jgi:4-hydroxy-tetrahydrodipicolinate synthase
LNGVITALATPFLPNGEIDFAAVTRMLHAQIAAGASAAVVAGSTGEAAALEESEFLLLLQHCVRVAQAAMPAFRIIAGTGLSATRKTIAQTALAQQAGAHAALVVAPAYVRPTPEGMFQHFTAIADASAIPIILYNVPARTACDLPPAIVSRLRRHKNIIAIKEALPDMQRMRELVALQNDSFQVLSGDDPSALEAFRLGACGLISVAGNVVPEAMMQLWTSAQHPAPMADALQQKLMPLFDALSLEPNPIPVKYACAQRFACTDSMRLPLLSLSEMHRAPLRACLSAILASSQAA